MPTGGDHEGGRLRQRFAGNGLIGIGIGRSGIDSVLGMTLCADLQYEKGFAVDHRVGTIHVAAYLWLPTEPRRDADRRGPRFDPPLPLGRAHKDALGDVHFVTDN